MTSFEVREAHIHQQVDHFVLCPLKVVACSGVSRSGLWQMDVCLTNRTYSLPLL